MKIWSDLHGDMQLTQMPKVGSPGAGPGLPIAGAIPRLQLAICWEPRVSGATSLTSVRR